MAVENKSEIFGAKPQIPAEKPERREDPEIPYTIIFPEKDQPIEIPERETPRQPVTPVEPKVPVPAGH